MDLQQTVHNSRVTFQAENNLDFRLGTGSLRYSKAAEKDDLAALSRIGEDEYELRIIKHGTPFHTQLRPYAINYIGHQDKPYGFIENDDFRAIIGAQLPSTVQTATLTISQARRSGSAED